MTRLLPVALLFVTLVVGANLAKGEGNWPQWRGPNRDGKSNETGLIDEFTKDGPPLVWQAEGLGGGYSSVSVADGRIFTLGRIDKSEHLIALDAKDGSLLWSTAFGSGGHSNGTPTVDGDRVYAVGLNGDLICADVKTGDKVWTKNFGKDFGGRMMSGWGYSESPLIDGDWLVCTPGAKDAMIVALNKTTGEEVWRTPVPDFSTRGKDGAGYSSIVVTKAAGVKQYVQLTGRGVIGVRANDGKFLWGYEKVANGTANIPTPIVTGDYVFCSSGYGTGAALLKLESDGDGVKAQEVYFLPGNTFQNHHGGMVLVGDHIYAGAQHNNGFPTCIELISGEIVWGGKLRGPGGGSAAITYADGHLVFRYQDGVVALIEATTAEYRLKGSFMPVYQQGRSWAHPVIAGGRMYLREQDRLMCYDVLKK